MPDANCGKELLCRTTTALPSLSAAEERGYAWLASQQKEGQFAGGGPRALPMTGFGLMALIIAIGFVVDDAIVVVENIYRHMEEGQSPLDAALAGSREIAFTIVSISVSLVAVFIPLLLMGGIVGRRPRVHQVIHMTCLTGRRTGPTIAPVVRRTEEPRR